MTTGRINQVTISNAVESESINRVALAGARDDRSLSLKDSIARKDVSDTSRSFSRSLCTPITSSQILFPHSLERSQLARSQHQRQSRRLGIGVGPKGSLRRAAPPIGYKRGLINDYESTFPYLQADAFTTARLTGDVAHSRVTSSHPGLLAAPAFSPT